MASRGLKRIGSLRSSAAEDEDVAIHRFAFEIPSSAAPWTLIHSPGPPPARWRIRLDLCRPATIPSVIVTVRIVVFFIVKGAPI
jgi:hypothetical protein